MLNPIKVGVSTCLLGEKVRYDGNHSHDRYLTQTLSMFTDYVPVCPEVECGLPVPRETMRLVGDKDNPRLMTAKTGIDMTEKMKTWCKKRLKELENEDLCGFIFRSKSPSSGLYRVRIYGETGRERTKGTGLFARAFTDHFPLIPVEEAGRLNDPKIREHFIENIFSLQRWRQQLKSNKTMGGLVDFHTRNKLLILSHSQDQYRKLGKLVADGKSHDIHELFDLYGKILLKALKLQITQKKNINVLLHIMGYFKRDLSGSEKVELLSIIDQYRDGYVPLIVPITLIRHYVMKYEQPWLEMQTYLNPHPFELKLRNYF